METIGTYGPVAGKLVGPAYNVTKGTLDIVHADEDYRGCRISAQEAHAREGGAILRTAGKTGGGIAGGIAGGVAATSWIPLPGARVVGGFVGGIIGSFVGGAVAEPLGEATGSFVGGDNDCYYDHLNMKPHP